MRGHGIHSVPEDGPARLPVQVTGEHTRVHNRIHKVLEDANSKLDTVLSDLLGVSGRARLRGLIQGRTDPAARIA